MGRSVAVAGLEVVRADGEIAPVAVAVALPLERRRHLAVQQRAALRQERVARDLPNAVVGELEAVVGQAEDLAPDQHLDPRRHLRLRERHGGGEQVERELPADHGGGLDQPPEVGVQALQAAEHERAHAGRQREPAGDGARSHRAERARGLHDHERVALGRLPDPVVEALVRPRAGRQQRPGEASGLGAGQRADPELHAVPAPLQLVARLAEEGIVAGVLDAARAEDHRRPRADPPGDVGEQAHAQLVRPLEVLEHQEERLRAGEAAQEVGDRLEGPRRITARGARRLALPQLRQQPRQLRPPGRGEAGRQRRLLRHTAGAERVDPRRQRQDALGLVAAAEEDAAAPARRQRGQLGRQPALADARRARDAHEAALPPPRRVEDLGEPRHLARAADERRGRLARRSRRAFVGPGPGRALAALLHDLLVERPRLRLRLGAQLAVQRGHAVLVLAQRRLAPPGLRVEPHERAVHGLLQRVDGEQAPGGLDGVVDAAGRPAEAEQTGERLQGNLAQPLALGQQPLLERRLRDREPGEEVAAVQGPDPLERVGSGIAGRGFEGVDVRGQGVGGEAEARALVEDRGLAERFADRVDGLAEARPRLGFGQVAPQEA